MLYCLYVHTVLVGCLRCKTLASMSIVRLLLGTAVLKQVCYLMPARRMLQASRAAMKLKFAKKKPQALRFKPAGAGTVPASLGHQAVSHDQRV